MIMSRGIEALRHIANGCTIDQVADKMNLSRSSVEKLLKKTRVQVGGKTLAHAVYIATRGGFIALLIAVVIMTPTGRIAPRVARVTRVRNELAVGLS